MKMVVQGYELIPSSNLYGLYEDDNRASACSYCPKHFLYSNHLKNACIAEGPRLVRLAGNIGDRIPIHAAAGAKAILAFLKLDARNALLDVSLHRFTEHTITEKAMLLEQFKEIRRLGVSFDLEEIDEGTSAIGAPIFNHEEKPVASIVIAGPSQRITANNSLEMISALKEAAAKISARLYYNKSIPQTDRDTK